MREKGAPARSEREKEKDDGVSQGRPVFFFTLWVGEQLHERGTKRNNTGDRFIVKGFLEWPLGQPIRYGSLFMSESR